MSILRLKSKQELATEAQTLAKSFQLVYYRNNLYIPLHYETGEPNAIGDPTCSVWEVMDVVDVMRYSADQFQSLFVSDSELRSFYFMVSQAAELVTHTVPNLLLRTEDGLKLLNDKGKLVEPDGSFVANTLQPTLNTNEDDKTHVMKTITNWLSSDEEAESLLSHLATVLSPGWSAVKYVLLLGEGRNGKGVLLGMMERLFGDENLSRVPRQEISKRAPMVIDLNGKLINLVSDGPMEYIKDSGTEKTLVAGEVAYIKDLYKAAPVSVQTNALFVEALNAEPMSRDKSSALQKRLARFYFNNVYALDKAFESFMWSDKIIGAFLAVLIDHYVLMEDAAERLSLTETSQLLQIEHMYQNSVGLQFLKQLWDDSQGDPDVIGKDIEELAKSFIIWRQTQGDKVNWELAEVTRILQQVFVIDRKSKREKDAVRKIKVVSAYRAETERYLETLEGSADETAFKAMVDD